MDGVQPVSMVECPAVSDLGRRRPRQLAGHRIQTMICLEMQSCREVMVV
jgi:hypothetical protein